MVKNISIEYANAYREVLEILSKISKNDYNKIPRDMIQVFEIYSNKEYAFEYDLKKDFDQQGISKRAKLILAILFRDYWANDNQREKIISKQNYDRQKLEEEKRKIYNTDIFKNKENNIKTDGIDNISEQVNMIQYEHKELIIKKILNKLKSIFRK